MATRIGRGRPRSAGARAARLSGRAVITVGLLVGVMAATSGSAGASAASQKAQAKKHLLVLSDMPKAWKTEKGNASSGNGKFPGASQLASCIGVSPSLISSNPPEADSPYFENKGGSLEVQDSVSVFPSVKNAKAEYAAIANAKTPTCMATLMNGPFKAQIVAAAGKGATIGTITATAIDPSSYGPHTTGFTLSVPISVQGASITAQLTSVYFIKGALGQQIDFNAYGPPFTSASTQHLTSVALGRL
jgi:hypothetical protein